MPRRHGHELDPRVTVADRLWVLALLAVAFADVILVLYVLPLFD